MDKAVGAQTGCNSVAPTKFSCRLLDQAAIAHTAKTLKIAKAFQPGIFAFPAIPGKGAGAGGVAVSAGGGGAAGEVVSVGAAPGGAELGATAGGGGGGAAWLVVS
jgi:hypothetical protein